MRKSNTRTVPLCVRIDNNILLTDAVKMSLNTRQHRENLNVMIVGGSGSGKTRFYGKPNIMQLNTSLVITDPKGEILQSTGKMLSESGYEVKVFNLINMKNSSNYNPFNYVYDFNGKLDYNRVIKMINVLMKNTAEDGGGKGDQFWTDSAAKLLTAIALLLLEEGKKSEQSFAGVAAKMRLIEYSKDPRDKTFQSRLDKEFEVLRSKKPNDLAVKYYTEFQKYPADTALSVVSTANSRTQMFNLPEVCDLTHVDTINLHEIGDRKTALFVIIPASDTTFNFLAAMMYTQMFDALYDRANFKYGGRLPVHVRCILDEFANIGTIPNFDKLIATMRSMEISVNVILQTISQLKTMYEKSWETIMGNCDSFLFLGGKEESTLKMVSEMLGKETIDIEAKNRTRSHRNNSTAESNSILGRELMQPNELSTMPPTDCILSVRAFNPFYGKKFDIEKHPNYRFLEDFDKSNKYNYSDVHTLAMPNEITDEKVKEKLLKEKHFHNFNRPLRLKMKKKESKNVLPVAQISEKSSEAAESIKNKITECVENGKKTIKYENTELTSYDIIDENTSVDELLEMLDELSEVFENAEYTEEFSGNDSTDDFNAEIEFDKIDFEAESRKFETPQYVGFYERADSEDEDLFDEYVDETEDISAFGEEVSELVYEDVEEIPEESEFVADNYEVMEEFESYEGFEDYSETESEEYFD